MGCWNGGAPKAVSKSPWFEGEINNSGKASPKMVFEVQYVK